MKKLIIIICVLFLYSSICYADISIALKTGLTSYDEYRPSKYIGNTCYDSPEFNYGGFLRYVKDNWILRFDIDKNSTGNTFLHQISQPYEKMDITQTNFTLSFGSYLWEYLYILGGLTYTRNKGEIEQYEVYPFNYKFKDSISPALTLGFEMPIDRWFFFMEYRRIWDDLDVEINGSQITDDVDRDSTFVGLGVRF